MDERVLAFLREQSLEGVLPQAPPICESCTSIVSLIRTRIRGSPLIRFVNCLRYRCASLSVERVRERLATELSVGRHLRRVDATAGYLDGDERAAVRAQGRGERRGSASVCRSSRGGGGGSVAGLLECGRSGLGRLWVGAGRAGRPLRYGACSCRSHFSEAAFPRVILSVQLECTAERELYPFLGASCASFSFVCSSAYLLLALLKQLESRLAPLRTTAESDCASSAGRTALHRPTWCR